MRELIAGAIHLYMHDGRRGACLHTKRSAELKLDGGEGRARGSGVTGAGLFQPVELSGLAAANASRRVAGGG